MPISELYIGILLYRMATNNSPLLQSKVSRQRVLSVSYIFQQKLSDLAYGVTNHFIKLRLKLISLLDIQTGHVH